MTRRSGIISGRLRLEPHIVSLSEILRAAVEQMRPTFDHSHVQLTTAIEDGQYRVSADPVRLQQIFTNLLSNAAKFTPAGGHVAVEATSTTRTARVTIKDDGVGISPEFMAGEDGFTFIHNLRSRRNAAVASIPAASITRRG